MQKINIKEGPVLVFGGPYSNLQATRAIFEKAKQLKIPPSNIICNGDLVAYCANPDETVDLIRNWKIHVVMGNCEESIGNQQDDCGCGFEENTLCSILSDQWYRFAISNVSTKNQQWMRDLPRKIQFSIANRQFAVVHGGIDSISEFVFSSSNADKKLNDIKILGVDCIIGGHCGLPFGTALGKQYWLNTGVIGIPANDGSRDGWYLILEPRDYSVAAHWHRLTFDTHGAVKSMEKANLGDPYKNALLDGLWPSMDVLPPMEKSAQGIRLKPSPITIN